MLVANENGQKLVGVPSIENVEDSEDWQQVDELFVDSSGFGWEGEPALTIEQFYKQVKKGFGYAVVDSGQFQVFVGVFEKQK